MYCYTHCCHHCHICHPVIAPAPQFWCGFCRRYTHHHHAHHYYQPVWPFPQPVRPTITCGPHQRDRNTIAALAG